MVSLIGIRILCKAGCKVVFDNKKCEVFYKNKMILRGYKDLTTDLWTLPIINKEIAIQTKSQCDGQPSHQGNQGLPHPAAGNTSIG